MKTKLKLKMKMIFPLLAIFLLTPWPVAYAYDNAMAGQAPIQIEVAETSAAPNWTAFGGAIGGATPGDLFYIDATNNAVDTLATIHLTNADKLINYYRYLILEVGIYVQNGTGQWQKAATGSGEPIPETYITMRNGVVSFSLPGYARYKVAIDGGSFYCYGGSADGDGISPRFYLTAE